MRKVSDTARKTIHVKWVRSGIGFSHLQKRMIRSLGFGRLNEVVERPDTPQTRGVVTRLAHLVEIVERPKPPAWASVPEYAIRRKDSGSELASEPATDHEAAAPVSAAGSTEQKEENEAE
jgi:large subunit ribosomal protein L30